MKYLVLISTIFFFSACTTHRPIELAPEIIQSRVISGELLRVGDNVKIITTDGHEYRFNVREITDTNVNGVAIADIAVLEVRQYSKTKTNWLIFGSATFVALVAYTLNSLSQLNFGF